MLSIKRTTNEICSVSLDETLSSDSFIFGKNMHRIARVCTKADNIAWVISYKISPTTLRNSSRGHICFDTVANQLTSHEHFFAVRDLCSPCRTQTKPVFSSDAAQVRFVSKIILTLLALKVFG